MIKNLILLVVILFSLASSCAAQELVFDTQTTMKAKVLRVESSEEKTVEGTEVKNLHQTLRVIMLEGSEEGEEIVVENDYLKLRQGDKFYLIHTVDGENGREYYTVSEPYRMPVVYFFIVLFIVLVIIFGGIQGIRGLASLAGSFVLIIYLLLPGILHGYSPLLMSVSVAALIIIVGSYITHGFNKTTTSAVFGMIITVIVTGVLAYAAVHYAKLSGFASDEAVYLNLDTRGSIDFVGLLMGGILIGLLGVLYDVAIGQAISVEELHRAGPHLSRGFIYARALRIGREHIGALVNTLAIAYVGAALPLLLLFYASTAPTSHIVNREIFATEILRTMIGSIGLVIAVPITTFIAVIMLMKHEGDTDETLLGIEKKRVEHMGHMH
jgi:uncharacterized membrane protein